MQRQESVEIGNIAINPAMQLHQGAINVANSSGGRHLIGDTENGGGTGNSNSSRRQQRAAGSSINGGGAGTAGGAAPPQPVLKCPRCESINTKFCYYNNYSTSQPRHFCKHCRRYWTEGGSLRNVPIGGGCRKNKRAASGAKQRTGGGGSYEVHPAAAFVEDVGVALKGNSNMLPHFVGGSGGLGFLDSGGGGGAGFLQDYSHLIMNNGNGSSGGVGAAAALLQYPNQLMHMNPHAFMNIAGNVDPLPSTPPPPVALIGGGRYGSATANYVDDTTANGCGVGAPSSEQYHHHLLTMAFSRLQESLRSNSSSNTTAVTAAGSDRIAAVFTHNPPPPPPNTSPHQLQLLDSLMSPKRAGLLPAKCSGSSTTAASPNPNHASLISMTEDLSGFIDRHPISAFGVDRAPPSNASSSSSSATATLASLEDQLSAFNGGGRPSTGSSSVREEMGICGGKLGRREGESLVGLQLGSGAASRGDDLDPTIMMMMPNTNNHNNNHNHNNNQGTVGSMANIMGHQQQQIIGDDSQSFFWSQSPWSSSSSSSSSADHPLLLHHHHHLHSSITTTTSLT